ncbi:IS66 family insertion sequence element accessory protein TnpA [Escherichia coli]
MAIHRTLDNELTKPQINRLASGLSRMAYCDQFYIPNKSMRYWPKDIARADRTAHGLALIPVSIIRTSGVSGGRLRLPPLTNRYR